MEFFFNPVTGRVEQRQVNNNLPFRSMTELASEINQFPFLPPSPTVPLDAFKNTVAPMAVNTKINNTIPTAMFLDNAGLPAIDTSFGVANEEDVEQDIEESKKRTSGGGIADLFRAILGFAVPGLNLLTGGLDGIKSLNQRLRDNDFARSSTGAEYFQKRRDRKAREDAAKRGADKQRIINLRDFNQGAGKYFSGSNDSIGSAGGGTPSPGSLGPGGSDEMGSF